MKLKYVLLMITVLFLSSCANTDIAVLDSSSFQNTTLEVNSTAITVNDYFVSCSVGDFTECRTVRKFGHNNDVSTTLEPIAASGFYRTPTTAVTLEVISDSALDNNGSTGVWSIVIFGLNSSFEEINETIIMNGTNPSLPTTKQFIRLFRAYVLETGTYATQSSASQKGIITIREQGGGDIWLQIDEADTGFGSGQSQVGVYTIPKGWTGYLMSKCISIESNQPADIFFFKRLNADDITPPYGAMRLVEEEQGVENFFCVNFKSPIQSFPEKSDVGFMGKKSGAGSASISVDFELLLIKNQ